MAIHRDKATRGIRSRASAVRPGGLFAVAAKASLLCAVALIAVPLLLAQQARQPEAAPAAADNKGLAEAWDGAWEEAELVGEEGEPVDVIFEDGWKIVGERAIGIAIYEAPPFEVPVRKYGQIPMFPCSDCHVKRKPDYRRRALKDEHIDLVFQHGANRLWCNACHDGKNMDKLVLSTGHLIDIDSAYLLCGQCHFDKLKDWLGGSHTKRVGLWQGTRVLRNCPTCHNAHAPRIKPFDPGSPPELRAGLVRDTRPSERHAKPWEENGNRGGAEHGSH